MLERNGTCKRLQTVSKEVTNEWNFCKQLKTHSSKQYERMRHPTHTGHCGLSACMTSFSQHRTSKRDCAQTRLSALRRKLVSEEATRTEQMGKFWETQHLHERHRLMTLSWQLRRWARQLAAARRTSLESELHRAPNYGRSHELHRLTQLLAGKRIGVRKRLFFHLLGSRPEQDEMKTYVVDIRETEREFQSDVPPLEPLDMGVATRHAQRVLHTRCSAHHSNGTLIDQRNGQKSNAGHPHYSRPLPSVEESLRTDGERNGFGRGG